MWTSLPRRRRVPKIGLSRGPRGCLSVGHRHLLLEPLEPRRMLTLFDSGAISSLQNQFSSLPTELTSGLSSATGTCKTRVQSLTAVESQVTSAISSAESSLQLTIQSIISNAGNQVDSLENQFQAIQDGAASNVQGQVVQKLYNVLGPSGADILAPTSFTFPTPSNPTPNNQSQPGDIHVVTPFSYPGTPNGVPNGELEMRLDVSYAKQVNFDSILQNLPIQFAPNTALSFSASANMELAIQFSNSGDGISFPAAHLSDNNVTVPNGATTAQAQSQLMFSVNATIANGSGLTAYVGFLQGNLTDTGSNDGIHASVYATSLTSPSLPSPAISGSANLNIGGTLQLNVSGNNSGGVQTDMPSVGTTLSLTWNDLSQTSGTNGPNFKFGDMTLNVGTFLQSAIEPYLSGLEQTISPIVDALKVFTDPIPGISDIYSQFGLGTPPSVISLLAATGLISSSDAQEIMGIANLGVELKKLLNYIPANGGGSIDFKDISLDPDKILSMTSAPQGLLGTTIPEGVSLSDFDAGDLLGTVSADTSYLSQIDSGEPQNANFVSTLMTGSGSAGSPSLDFPIFDDPKCILNMLFGQNVDLVTFDSGQFNTPSIGPFGFDVSIPIIGPFGVDFGMNINVYGSGEIKVGYDTQGVRDFLRDGCAPSAISDLLNGVYVNPSTNLTLHADAAFHGGVGVSVGFASATLALNCTFGGTIGVKLNTALANGDPEGRIRLGAIDNDFSNAFVPTGSFGIQVGLGLESASRGSVAISPFTICRQSRCGIPATTSVPGRWRFRPLSWVTAPRRGRSAVTATTRSRSTGPTYRMSTTSL